MVVSICGALRMTRVLRNSVKLLQSMYFMLWAARGGTKTGMHRHHPPQGYTNALQTFSVRKSGVFHNPMTNALITTFLLRFYVYFIGFLASPNPGLFWLLPLLHYQVYAGGCTELKNISFTLSRLTQWNKKSNKKKSKEQWEKMWRCHG